MLILTTNLSLFGSDSEVKGLKKVTQCKGNLRKIVLTQNQFELITAIKLFYFIDIDDQLSIITLLNIELPHLKTKALTYLGMARILQRK